jgi:hypothetical protein
MPPRGTRASPGAAAAIAAKKQKSRQGERTPFGQQRQGEPASMVTSCSCPTPPCNSSRIVSMCADLRTRPPTIDPPHRSRGSIALIRPSTPSHLPACEEWIGANYESVCVAAASSSGRCRRGSRRLDTYGRGSPPKPAGAMATSRAATPRSTSAAAALLAVLTSVFSTAPGSRPVPVRVPLVGVEGKCRWPDTARAKRGARGPPTHGERARSNKCYGSTGERAEKEADRQDHRLHGSPTAAQPRSQRGCGGVPQFTAGRTTVGLSFRASFVSSPAGYVAMPHAWCSDPAR